MSVEAWHQRFSLQARWTQPLREHLFCLPDRAFDQRVLEVGVGTGAVLQEIASHSGAALHGCDLREDFLARSTVSVPGAALVQADAHDLPYHASGFDLVVCHYLLMWLPEPLSCLMEMKRITRSGGMIAALAEPDYGGRLDYPDRFRDLKKLQIQSLQNQGADPLMGRKLPGLFATLGLNSITSGVYQGRWEEAPSEEETISEWTILQQDLQGFVSEEEIRELKAEERKARAAGTRVVFLPTFYTYGIVS